MLHVTNTKYLTLFGKPTLYSKSLYMYIFWEKTVAHKLKKVVRYKLKGRHMHLFVIYFNELNF